MYISDDGIKFSKPFLSFQMDRPNIFYYYFQISLIDIPVVPRHPVGIPLYDKDKLAWEMETDTNAETLRLRLIHKDAKNIPRNHIR